MRAAVRDSLVGIMSESITLSRPELVKHLMTLCSACDSGGVAGLIAGAFGMGSTHDFVGTRVKRVTIKHFMDADTLISERLEQCCVHVGSAGNDPVRMPFCAARLSRKCVRRRSKGRRRARRWRIIMALDQTAIDTRRQRGEIVKVGIHVLQSCVLGAFVSEIHAARDCRHRHRSVSLRICVRRARMALIREAALGRSGDGWDRRIPGVLDVLPCLRRPPKRSRVRTATRRPAGGDGVPELQSV